MKIRIEPVRVCQKLASKNEGGNFSRWGAPKMPFRHAPGRRGRDGGREGEGEGEGEGEVALHSMPAWSQNGFKKRVNQ